MEGTAMGQATPPERLLTVEEIAERLRVSEETVRRYLREYVETKGARGLRGIQLSRRSGWRVRESDLQRWIAEHVPGETGEA